MIAFLMWSSYYKEKTPMKQNLFIGMIAFINIIFIFPYIAEADEAIRLSSIDDPISALSEKILFEAYKRIGINVLFDKLPAARALRESDSGKTDGETNRVNGII